MVCICEALNGLSLRPSMPIELILSRISITEIRNNILVKDALAAGIWESLLFVGGEGNLRSIFASERITGAIRTDEELSAFLSLPQSDRIAEWKHTTQPAEWSKDPEAPQHLAKGIHKDGEVKTTSRIAASANTQLGA